MLIPCVDECVPLYVFFFGLNRHTPGIVGGGGGGSSFVTAKKGAEAVAEQVIALHLKGGLQSVTSTLCCVCSLLPGPWKLAGWFGL